MNGQNLTPAIPVAAAGGSNPFPGAVAGVYSVAGSSELGSRAAYSVDYDGSGNVWVSSGPGAWQRLSNPGVIADVTELPVAETGETFGTGCLIEDSGGNIWRGNGDVGWVRIVAKPVANVAALPEPATGETFAGNLLCYVADPGIVYQWDGSAWGLP